MGKARSITRLRSKRWRLLALPALAALVAAGLATGPAASSPDDSKAAPKRVYVMVIDGLRPDKDVNSTLTPNLWALREQGTWYKQPRALFVAETLPNHVAMMTGVRPERSGIVGNSYRKENSIAPSDKQTMGDPRLLLTDTLVTRLERSCGPSVNTATTLSKTYLDTMFRGEADPGDPNRQLEADFHWNPRPIIPVSEHAPDASTMNDAFLPWMRSAPTPQFAFVNLGDVDRAGHADEGGAQSDGADAFHQGAIKATDELVGQFVQELKDKGWWQDTVLFVLSDHGMDWSTPENQIDLDAELAGAGYLTPQQFMIVNNGAADMVYLNERDPAKRAAIIEEIKSTTGIDRVFTDRTGLTPAQREREHLRSTYGLNSPRAGDVIVLASPHYRLSPSGPRTNPVPGNHGHAVTQHSTLLVTGGHPSLLSAGAGARPGEQIDGAVVYTDPPGVPLPPDGGPGPMSIAPTVAALLGLGDIPGGYDGPVLTEAFDPDALDFREGVCDAVGSRAAPGSGGGSTSNGSSGGPTGQSGGGTVTTTLAARRARVAFRRELHLSGRTSHSPGCAAPRWVEIRRRTYGKSQFEEVTDTPVIDGGAWEARLPADRSASYVAVPDSDPACSVSPSEAVSVAVPARIALVPPASCRRPAVSGAVSPAQPRTAVTLQRKSGRRWRTIARGRLNRRSRFSLRLPGCAQGRYRVLWNGGATATNAPAQAAFRL